jgi:hypothetical protein
LYAAVSSPAAPFLRADPRRTDAYHGKTAAHSSTECAESSLLHEESARASWNGVHHAQLRSLESQQAMQQAASSCSGADGRRHAQRCAARVCCLTSAWLRSKADVSELSFSVLLRSRCAAHGSKKAATNLTEGCPCTACMDPVCTHCACAGSKLATTCCSSSLNTIEVITKSFHSSH